MGKLFVPFEPRTPANQARAALDEVERIMPSLRGSGPQVVRLLHVLDQIDEMLAELETNGLDARAERARFETVQEQLRRYQRRFLAEAGAALKEERAIARPGRARWWWFLDEAAAQERRLRLRQALTWSLAVVIILAAAWFAYDRFIAPPPNVRQAFRHTASGKALAEQGDLGAALAEFEAAAALTPADPVPWLWQGVMRFELAESDAARAAFDTARSLYETEFDFLLARSIIYLRVGDMDAASADVEQAILDNPDSGMAYYVRSSVAVGRENYAAAIADLERAAELAQEAGDAQLEAAARVQLGMIAQQLPAFPQSTSSP